MTYKEKLDTIKGIPNSAFYYLGQVDMWKRTLKADLSTLNAHTKTAQNIVQCDYKLIGTYSQKFCKAMGWI